MAIMRLTRTWPDQDGNLVEGKAVLINTDKIVDIEEAVTHTFWHRKAEEHREYAVNTVYLDMGKGGSSVKVYEDIDEIHRRWQEALDNESTPKPIRKFNTSAAKLGP